MKKNTALFVVSAFMLVLVIVGAFIKIPLLSVPFTLQVMFVNLVAMILPKRYTLLTMGSYLVLGLIGIPIFAQGGGFWYVLNPTFGYIIGFLVGAFIASSFLDKFGRNSFKNYGIATFINLFIIYLFGLVYLYIILVMYKGKPLGISNIFLIGFTPFILMDIVTCVVSVIVANRLNKIMSDRNYF